MRERLKLSLAALVVVLLGALPAFAQTGRVGGVVKDDKGQPLKGATVVAENPAASPPSFSSTTDDKGRFSIIGLRAGTWKLTASAPGFSPSVGQVPIRTIGQPNPPVEFVLAPGAGAMPGMAGVNTKELQTELAAADAKMMANDFDGAIAAYQGLITKVPQLTALYLQIGRAQRMKKDYAGALETYAKIPAGDPKHAFTFMELPPFVRLAERFREAIERRDPAWSPPGAPRSPTFADALATQRIIDAMRASSRDGGAWVDVPAVGS